jgi:hypothetical protein
VLDVSVTSVQSAPFHCHVSLCAALIAERPPNIVTVERTGSYASDAFERCCGTVTGCASVQRTPS